MKYLVTGSNYEFDLELIQNALEDLNEEDTILITASTIVEDQVAKLAFEAGASLKTKSPDNSLRGNSSRFYALSELAKEADCMILFTKSKDKEINEIKLIAQNADLELREYIKP